MDKMREQFVQEMEKIYSAAERSDSPYLKADYMKAYKKMQKELSEYDGYKHQKQSRERETPH